TGANQANTSKDKHDDVTVKQDKDESKDHHSGKKGAAIGAGTAGLAGGAASKSASAASKPHASNNASQNHDE
ncbi:peptidoglycan-binding protein LysM, partial [Staphylococcus aureus]|nr:peptidoglycan-binding protein LysM [Staphylococcus aureus]